MGNYDLEKVLQQANDEQEKRSLASYIGEYDKFKTLNEEELDTLKRFIKLENHLFKQFNGELTTDELKFIYGLFKITDYFDYTKFSANLSNIKKVHDKQIKPIVKTRNITEDLAEIYGCLPEEIGFNYCDLVTKKCKVFYGHLNLNDFKKSVAIYSLLAENFDTISSMCSYEIKDAINCINISSLPFIHDHDLEEQLNKKLIEMTQDDGSKELKQYLESLLNLKIVIGDIYIDDQSSSIGLNNLEEMWGDISSQEIYHPNLNNLKIVGGDFYLCNVTDASGLENLNYVGDNLYIPKLKDTKGLENLSVVCGNLNFGLNCNLEGLINLKYVGAPKRLLEIVSPEPQSKQQQLEKNRLVRLKQKLAAIFYKDNADSKKPEKIKVK